MSSSTNAGSVSGTTNVGGIVGLTGEQQSIISASISGSYETKGVGSESYILNETINEELVVSLKYLRLENSTRIFAGSVKVAGAEYAGSFTAGTDKNGNTISFSSFWGDRSNNNDLTFNSLTIKGNKGTYYIKKIRVTIAYTGTGLDQLNYLTISASVDYEYQKTVPEGITIKNCYNSGEVESNDYAGGILGRTSLNSTVEYSKNAGKITGANIAGGIVGGSYPGGNFNTGTISNCSNKGLVGSNNNGWVALVGCDMSSITDCYGGATPNDETSIKTMLHGNYNTYYDSRHGTLSSEPTGMPDSASQDVWSNYTSEPGQNSDDHYLIYTAEELAWVANNVTSKAVVLMNDIDLSAHKWDKSINDSVVIDKNGYQIWYNGATKVGGNYD